MISAKGYKQTNVKNYDKIFSLIDTFILVGNSFYISTEFDYDILIW